MAVERMDHVGIVVDDLAAAIGFFTALGLEEQGGGQVEGGAVDRVVSLDGVRSELVFMRTPDGHGRLELIEFHNPPADRGDEPPAPANALGIRHVTFAVDDLDATLTRLRAHGAELVGEVVRFENSYRVCYVHGPAGIIVELAEPLT